MTFDLADFIAPLDPLVIVLSIVLGVIMGFVVDRADHPFNFPHLYWQLAGGAVFFIPLALIRAGQGSTVWERFLATYILWVLFCLGMFIGSKVVRR